MFVYPALIEGFGIPIMEALQSETPVLTSKGGVFGEAGGKAARYADPNSCDSIASEMIRIWENENMRLEMVEKGKLHAQKFGRELLAQQWIELYRGLLEENK